MVGGARSERGGVLTYAAQATEGPTTQMGAYRPELVPGEDVGGADDRLPLAAAMLLVVVLAVDRLAVDEHRARSLGGRVHVHRAARRVDAHVVLARRREAVDEDV